MVKIGHTTRISWKNLYDLLVFSPPASFLFRFGFLASPTTILLPTPVFQYDGGPRTGEVFDYSPAGSVLVISQPDRALVILHPDRTLVNHKPDRV